MKALCKRYRDALVSMQDDTRATDMRIKVEEALKKDINWEEECNREYIPLEKKEFSYTIPAVALYMQKTFGFLYRHVDDIDLLKECTLSNQRNFVVYLEDKFCEQLKPKRGDIVCNFVMPLTSSKPTVFISKGPRLHKDMYRYEIIRREGKPFIWPNEKIIGCEDGANS